MSLDISYIDNGKGVYCAVNGEVTLDDFLKGSNEAYSEPYLKTQRYQIVDFTNCSSFNLSSDDMVVIAKMDKEISRVNPNIFIAIIAPSDITFGMSRVYQAYAEETGFKIEVFRNRELANVWIGRNVRTDA
ncbi:MAG: hypothetical protein ACQ9MH_24430 [Nitrospinales bacterium]